MVLEEQLKVLEDLGSSRIDNSSLLLLEEEPNWYTLCSNNDKEMAHNYEGS